MNWDIVSSPTQGLQLRLKPIGVIRFKLRDTAKKFGFVYSQKGIAVASVTICRFMCL
jgi:hypothetical protein